jgi:Domain of unknown function (DUF7014)
MVTKLFNRIFRVFSSRAPQGDSKHEIPSSFRNRVLMWLGDVYGNTRVAQSPAWSGGCGPGDYRDEFWNEVHRFLLFSRGVPRLTPHTTSPTEDAIDFLLSCEGEQFLDFVEYVFRVDAYRHVQMSDDSVVEELNELFRRDDLPYHLTGFLMKETRGIDGDGPFAGHETTTVETIAYPQVILRSSEPVHVHALEPALALLRRLPFRNANREFLEALDDLRRGDFDDCLTKCGSAFESAMKVICDESGWAYRDTDTAGKLVKILMDRLGLDSYHEPIFMIIATLRNRLSSSHGAGTSSRTVSLPVAQYAVNSTASTILFLAQKAGMA